MKRSILMLVGFALLFCGASRAIAGPVLWIDDSSGEIAKVDVATGNVTLIGNAGVVLTDIAFDPSGNLYGMDFTSLYSINQTTGAATLIGADSISGGNALTFASDGTLYGAGNASTSLYTINPSTGASTAVGGSIGTNSAGDLAFHNGILYLAGTNGDLVRLDTITGNGTNEGAFGVANVFGLANGDNNLLYAVAGTNVYSVDVSTGAATFVVDYSGQGLGDANGAAFFAEASSVPEPASVVLFIIAGLAGSSWRRWKQPAV